jgi:hypothetical protein
MAFDEIESGGLAVARARQSGLDFHKHTTGAGAHDDDAIGKHNGFIDVVRDDDERRLEVGPEREQVVLQIDALFKYFSDHESCHDEVGSSTVSC